MRCLTVRRHVFQRFVLFCEQEILRTLGALIHFEAQIPGFPDRSCPIGSSGSKECGLLAMLHRDEYKKLCQLGWIYQFTTFLQSEIAVSTL